MKNCSGKFYYSSIYPCTTNWGNDDAPKGTQNGQGRSWGHRGNGRVPIVENVKRLIRTGP